MGLNSRRPGVGIGGGDVFSGRRGCMCENLESIAWKLKR